MQLRRWEPPAHAASPFRNEEKITEGEYCTTKRCSGKPASAQSISSKLTPLLSSSLFRCSMPPCRGMRRWNAPLLSTAEVARACPLTIAMRAQRGHLVVCPYLVWTPLFRPAIVAERPRHQAAINAWPVEHLRRARGEHLEGERGRLGRHVDFCLQGTRVWFAFCDWISASTGIDLLLLTYFCLLRYLLSYLLASREDRPCCIARSRIIASKSCWCL